MINPISTVLVVGSGNVAYHLCKAFKEVAINVIIHGRNKKETLAISKELGLDCIPDLNMIGERPDIIFLAVSDDAILEVVKKIIPLNIPVVHTSGAVSTNVLGISTVGYGVFYPLQTLTKGVEIDFTEIPICITANTELLQKELLQLAKRVSSNVQITTDEQRKALHISAVLLNNFSNHLIYKASTVLSKSDLSFNLVLPLLKETIRKLQYETPKNAQTGPARRGDVKTIDAHIKWLEENHFPELIDLYKFMSNSIFKTYN